MKTLAIAALVAGLSVVGTAASADTPTPPSEKKICRSVEVTGSIMPKRTCHTKAEWAQIDTANARAVENARNMQSSASGTH